MKLCPRCEADVKGWPRPRIKWERWLVVAICLLIYGMSCVWYGMNRQSSFDGLEKIAMRARIQEMEEERSTLIKALMDQDTYRRVMSKVPR